MRTAKATSWREESYLLNDKRCFKKRFRDLENRFAGLKIRILDLGNDFIILENRSSGLMNRFPILKNNYQAFGFAFLELKNRSASLNNRSPALRIRSANNRNRSSGKRNEFSYVSRRSSTKEFAASDTLNRAADCVFNSCGLRAGRSHLESSSPGLSCRFTDGGTSHSFLARADCCIHCYSSHCVNRARNSGAVPVGLSRDRFGYALDAAHFGG